MQKLKQSISIMDSCSLVKKSNNPFSPIKEAIANSIDSISQRSESNNDFIPEIVVELYYTKGKNLFDENDDPRLSCILVKDNGVGLTQENYERFKNLADTTKNRNNRGTGKVQFFCRFEEVMIHSCYEENSKAQIREICWNRNGDFVEVNDFEQVIKMQSTIVELRKPVLYTEDEKAYLSYLCDGMRALKNEVYRFFLLRLWLEIERNKDFSLTINSFINDEILSSFSINAKTIIKPFAETDIELKKYSAEIKYEKEKTAICFLPITPTHSLQMDVFRINEDFFFDNCISLCSKGMMIESIPLPFVKKGELIDGQKVLVCVHGSLFDDCNYINLRGDKFVFPRKNDVEKEIKENGFILLSIDNGYYWFEEIKESITEKVLEVCNLLNDKKTQHENRVKEVSSFFHFPSNITEAVSKKSGITDSEKAITEKLFIEQAKKIADTNYSLKETYEKIKLLESKNINPLDDDYKEQIKKLANQLLEQIPLSNKDELSRYIIHRDLIVNVLDLILKQDLSIQKEWKERKKHGEVFRTEPEGLMHDLIIKRNTTDCDSNELWLFNEDFVHYSSCSDVPFSQMKINGEPLLESQETVEELIKKYDLETGGNNTNRRPDVFLYPEEGKCIIIEFKSYEDEVTKYLEQIPLYTKILVSYSRIPLKTVYGYLIGSNIDEIRINGWKSSIKKDYWTRPLERITSITNDSNSVDLYMELLDWSLLSDRARRRNNNFAQKLGIR